MHIHDLGSDLFSFNFKVSDKLYSTLEEIVWHIYLATCPYADAFNQPGQINPVLFQDSKLPIPDILGFFYSYKQDPLCTLNLYHDIHHFYKLTQKIGLDALNWIVKARFWCTMRDDHRGWHWPNIEVE